MTELMWNAEIYEAADEAAIIDAHAAGVTQAEHDPRLLRNTAGNFATGVTVVTYESGDAFHGVTVNSFTSVSLEPPLVLVSIMRTSRALNYLLERPFAINILSSEQMNTALEFAGRPQEGHRIEWVTGDGAPRINGTLAYYQCTPWAGYDGGDHVLLLGKVHAFGQDDNAEPILFYRGKWASMATDK